MRHKGYEHTEKSKKLMRLHNWSKRGYRPSMLGKHLSEKAKRKISLARLERKKRLGYLISSEARKKIRKNHSRYWLGKHHSDESRKKISLSLLKRKEKLGYINSPETRRKMSLARKGAHLSERAKLKVSIAVKNRPIEITRMCLVRRVPSNLEKIMIEIIKKYSLPYIFVGNGKFFIESYNPDFVNVNGQKIVLEVYAKYFKGLHGSIDSWKQKRRRAYGKYGYRVLFFNEAQTNENFIFKKLSSFSKS